MAVGYSRADILGYFYQHVPGGAIFNLVNSIKAQPIKLILGKPEQRRIGNILTHGLVFIGNGITPGGHSVLMKKARRQQREIVAFRPKMVQHDIENHRKP